MKISFSYAVALHRVLDSAPPEKAAVFRAGGRLLRPYQKPDGLYVFADVPWEELTVECSGYQTERFFPKPGEIRHLFLFPGAGFPVPPGWKAVCGLAAPGQVLFWRDEDCEIRAREAEPEKGGIRLHTRPGITGGCLLYSLAGHQAICMILEKQSPDWFLLYRMPAGGEKGGFQKGYLARADANGNCNAVIPAKFVFEFHMGWKVMMPDE